MSLFLVLVLLSLEIWAIPQTPLSITQEWDLNTPPNSNSTGHLVFDTASSLLQHWPNTRYHSGHTIVPGTIPPGTLLYHGRGNRYTPTASEWVAFDPEFARVFCDDPGPCWVHTLAATRPLRVLYFDGSSATKMPDGPMDAQDLLAWGTVLPDRATVEWEYERMNQLCQFGNKTRVDALVRMQLNFEIMLCNFTDGVEIITVSRLQDEARIPHYAFSFLHSSSWYDQYPGQPRIHLDLTQLISFYDVSLTPSLVTRRLGQNRRQHRILGISEHDVDAALARISSISYSQPNSGIDWATLFQVIRNRYAKRLEVLQSTLDGTAVDVAGQRAFQLLLSTLMPYRLHTAVPVSSGNAWAAPAFRLCTETPILFIQSLTLTASEELLLTSARDTSREICRTLVGMWAEGSVALLSSPTIPGSLVGKWKSEIDRLMSWLGWSVWITCRPACAFDEQCYLPGAPFSMDEWNISEPRCIRTFEPYTDWLNLQV
ncbi:hypothetical protein FB45DRAFT_825512 [Roridomyces roridus]|uniref:Uncharacterized protein n=1 Tax=Roridomyces roridus TaxID=1738132 RepID=A0AAD7C7Q4_9AGAR|nr:hypothetical protein FB45DRAFT_825512 [Roridomyces roridus]